VLCTIELRVFECKMIQRYYSTQKVATPPQESCWLCDAAQVPHCCTGFCWLAALVELSFLHEATIERER